MTIKVRLFAILRERAGTDSLELDLPAGATVADALRALAQRPGLEALAQGAARIAVNREYADPATRIGPEDEVAVIPPVSGGENLTELTRVGDGVHVAITAQRLDLGPLLQFVADEHAGAVISFQGLPRDIPVLDYEAYGEMAIERMWAILTDCRARHGLCAIAAEHRVGAVRASEASITIAVSAPHRGEAFAGAREALDRIKAEVPIWKVEVDADGARVRPDGTLPT
ncbi:molybdopterin converting factor subunit 1 [Conexibacter sp. DBS9H8]|uniref:molybdopterin converting factor subunit 1 n=1 Tax=Conexibacter sp. DBS9H8 TaxID=2937801 RepID=UPI00200D7FE9|nr:molybdopterin converting factor subunit 1 [Conexibacter sp. DBS9H8]